MSLFGEDHLHDSSEEMTVVYKLEPVDENEAAMLPDDLPEVVLDPGQRVMPDSASVLAEPVGTLPNGRLRPSNYSEYSYSPQIEFLPTGSVRKAASTINRTTSVEAIHYLHQRNKYKRIQAPAFTTASRKYGSEFGGGSRYAPSDVYATQVRRGYVIPYRPVYVKPQVPASYANSLSRASDINRVYRQPSNADTYTLSRPPGRAQPIKIHSNGQEPMRVQRNLTDVTTTHLMEQESHNWARQNDYVTGREAPRKQQNGNPPDLRHSSGSQYVIEAGLEPPKVHAPKNPHSSRASRTHVKDIQYEYQRRNNDIGGVEISPVASQDGDGSPTWQDVSLYVRRPSIEDVRRVHQPRAKGGSNGSYGMRVDTDLTPNARNQALPVVHNTTPTPVILNGGGRQVLNGGQRDSRVVSDFSVTSDISTGNRLHVTHKSSGGLAPAPQRLVSDFSVISNGGSNYSTGNRGQPLSGSVDRKYTIRTTIPRDPPKRSKPQPMIHLSDEAMHF